MRAIKLFIATSLDGHIARPDGNIDWLFHDQDYGYTPFYGQVDTVVMGRTTYDMVRSFGEPWPYAGKQCLVFSSRPEPDPRVRFVSGAVTGVMDALQQTPGRDIWLVGGAALVQQFLRADGVDDLILSDHPVLLGAGIPLFAGGMPERALRLVSTRAYDSGLVQLHYRRTRDLA